MARGIESGAEDFLPKPFDPVLLQARLHAGLEKKRLRDQEVEYLRQVAHLTEAAEAIEENRFAAESLDPRFKKDTGKTGSTRGAPSKRVPAAVQEIGSMMQQMMQQGPAGSPHGVQGPNSAM